MWPFLYSSILEASIKITNEPPTGMQANLHKALDNFDQVCSNLLWITIITNTFCSLVISV